jgi:hypothetical protein
MKTMLTARIQNDLFDALESVCTETKTKTYHTEKALSEYKPIKRILDGRKTEIEVPLGINLKAWDEWAEYRRSEKKRPITKAAAKKQFNLLLRYTPSQQQVIIDNSIQNDYQGLFPLSGQRQVDGRSFKEEHTNGDWRDGL